jgi:hypothetical protein
MIRIQFTITINATAEVLWRHITSLESYKHWAAAFAEGSYFQGSWDAGSKMLFLSPGGAGMVSEIAESRQNEFISIRHIGFISDGIEDTTSDAIRGWAPAYETYTLVPAPEGTTMVVNQDVAAEWEEDLSQAWPKALTLLKALCESTNAA